VNVQIQKPKVFQLQGASPDQGLCSWTPLGAPPQTPYYRGLTLVFGASNSPTPAVTELTLMGKQGELIGHWLTRT